MERLKVHYASWDQGRKAMELLGQYFQVQPTEREEFLYVKTDTVKASCHLDFNGEAFVLVKFTDHNEKQKLQDILSQVDKMQ